MLKQLYCRFDSHQQWSEIVCVREVEKDDKSIAMICFFLLLYGWPCPYYDVSLSYLFSVSVTKQSHVKSVKSLLTFHVLHSHCVSHCPVNRTFFSPFLRKKCEKGQCEFRSTCVRDARKRCEWPSLHEAHEMVENKNITQLNYDGLNCHSTNASAIFWWWKYFTNFHRESSSTSHWLDLFPVNAIVREWSFMFPSLVVAFARKWQSENNEIGEWDGRRGEKLWSIPNSLIRNHTEH